MGGWVGGLFFLWLGAVTVALLVSLPAGGGGNGLCGWVGGWEGRKVGGWLFLSLSLSLSLLPGG